MRRAAILLLPFLSWSTALAQAPQLVHEIHTSSIVGSAPWGFAATNNLAYFIAQTPSGAELWKSDGTDSGTRVVKQIAPPLYPGTFGLESGVWQATGLRPTLTGSGTMMYFVANDQSDGWSLWRTDGTAGGTIPLKKLASPDQTWNTTPHLAPLAGSRVVAIWGAPTPGMWTSDGTVAGTRQLQVPNGNSATLLTSACSQVLFAIGSALWTTDGSDAGTQQLWTSAHGGITSISCLSGHVLVGTSASGSDGDVWLGDLVHFTPSLLLHVDGRPDAAFATTQNQFFQVTGGSSAGIWVISTPGETEQIANQGALLGTVGATAFFETSSPSPGSVATLWATNGNSASTVALANVTSKIFAALASGQSRFYFMTCCDPVSPVWVTDGTATGTTKLGFAGGLTPTIPPGPPPYATALGDTLLFPGTDGKQTELWRSDGTIAGTAEVANLFPDGGSGPYSIAALGTHALFSAFDDQHGLELWTTDGTDVGTSFLKDLDPGFGSGTPLYLTSIGSTVVMQAADDLHGIEPWRSDGTENGTELLQDIYPGLQGSWPFPWVVNDGIAYFTIAFGPHGAPPGGNFWRTDGTSSGTFGLGFTSIPVIRPATDDDRVHFTPVIYDGKVCFVGRDGVHRTDGSQGGTSLIVPMTEVGQMMPVGTKLFFVRQDYLAGTEEIWVLSAPSAAPQKLAIGSFVINSSTLYPPAGATLLFRAAAPGGGMKLWQSDGTSSGTHVVTDFAPGSASMSSNTYCTGSTVVGPLMFFPINDGIHGCEMWVSDGSTAGTHMVADIAAGAGSSWPESIVTAFGHVYFSADDEAHGRELWTTDGTSAGTTFFDIEPGSRGSYPSFLSPFAHSLLFGATTASTSSQLWRLPIPPVTLQSVTLRWNPITQKNEVVVMGSGFTPDIVLKVGDTTVLPLYVSSTEVIWSPYDGAWSGTTITLSSAAGTASFSAPVATPIPILSALLLLVLAAAVATIGLQRV